MKKLPLHNLDASGTRDGSTFLSGDGTWRQPTLNGSEILPEPSVLLMSSFSNGDQRAFMLTSDDGGATFAQLPGSTPYADPDSSVSVRDPSICQFAGRYLLTHTRAPAADPLGASTTWGLAESTDLLTWTQVAVIAPASPGGIATLWAPDLFVDGDTLYCYWNVRDTATGSNHQTYVQAATLVDITAWSTPSLISGLGTNVIDTTVVRDGDTYVAIFKNENTAQLFKATATSPLGPFTADASPLPTGGTDRVEGPTLLRTPAGKWRLVYDCFDIHQLRYIESSDLVTWTAPVTITNPAGMSHPDALWLSHAELAGLRALWGSVRSIQPGNNVAVDATDPLRPKVSATLGGGTGATVGELLMQDGVTGPPVPLETEARDDWLYQG